MRTAAPAGRREGTVTAYRRVSARGRTPPRDAVEAGVRALEAPAILAHPTETVYGLGAGPEALDGAVSRLKGRDPDRPLLRIGPDASTIRGRHPALAWCRRADRLADRFWPGPVTLVLSDGSAEGLAVRVEGHPVTRAVLDAAGATMTSTSLNRTGEPPARSPESVAETLEAMPPVEAEVVWLDAGRLERSPPSTLVSLAGERPLILREGAVPAAQIEACLDEGVDRGTG